MNKRTIFVIGMSLLVAPSHISDLFAQGKAFRVGIQAGAFIPQYWQIQGWEQISYSNGSPTSVTVSGFGDGGELNLFGTYYFSDWGATVRTGVRLPRRELSMSAGPGGWRESYENRLTVIPLTFSLTRRASVNNSKFSSYFGIGIGLYISRWEQKHSREGAERTWLKGSSTPIGGNLTAGFDYPLYSHLLINCEAEYSYVKTDWEIQNVDTNERIELKNSNIGGISLRLGLAFEF